MKLPVTNPILNGKTFYKTYHHHPSPSLSPSSTIFMCLHNLILAFFVFVSVHGAQHWAQDRMGCPRTAKLNSSVLSSENDGTRTLSKSLPEKENPLQTLEDTENKKTLCGFYKDRILYLLRKEFRLHGTIQEQSGWGQDRVQNYLQILRAA